MQFFNIVKNCLIKCFDTSGRATRREYWTFQLFLIFVVVLCILLEIAIYYATNIYAFTLINIYIIFDFFLIILLFVFNFSATVRRLHDTDRSMAYMLLYLIPLVGTVINTVFLVQTGDICENCYGPPTECNKFDYNNRRITNTSLKLIERLFSRNGRSNSYDEYYCSNYDCNNSHINIDSKDSFNLDSLDAFEFEESNAVKPDPREDYKQDDDIGQLSQKDIVNNDIPTEEFVSLDIVPKDIVKSDDIVKPITSDEEYPLWKSDDITLLSQMKKEETICQEWKDSKTYITPVLKKISYE